MHCSILLSRVTLAQLLGAMLFLTLSLSAQTEPRRILWGPQERDAELTLSGGGWSDSKFSTGGGSINLSLGSYLSSTWEISLRQSLSFLDDDQGFDVRGVSRAALDYHFDLNRLQPFAGISLGGGYGDDISAYGLAGVEVGLKYYVQKKTFLFGLVEYGWQFDDWETITSNFDDGAFGYSIGIGFHF